MSNKGVKTVAGVYIPNPDGGVQRSADDVLSIKLKQRRLCLKQTNVISYFFLAYGEKILKCSYL